MCLSGRNWYLIRVAYPRCSGRIGVAWTVLRRGRCDLADLLAKSVRVATPQEELARADRLAAPRRHVFRQSDRDDNADCGKVSPPPATKSANRQDGKTERAGLSPSRYDAIDTRTQTCASHRGELLWDSMREHGLDVGKRLIWGLQRVALQPVAADCFTTAVHSVACHPACAGVR